jgi:hypothetical protein
VGRDQPSQRAILWRAIRDTPATLRKCLDRATSWAEVVELLIAFMGERRAEVAEADRQPDEDRGAVGRRQAPELLGEILRRSGS